MPKSDNENGRQRDSWLDQAFNEVGRTEISYSSAKLLVCVFAALLAGGLTAQLVRGPTRDALAGLISAGLSAGRPHAGLTALRAGNAQLLAAIDDTETRLEEDSVLRDLTLGAVHQLLLRVGHVGNRQVVLGRRDAGGTWLAYRPGVDYVIGKPFLDEHILRRRALGGESWRPPPAPDPRPAIRSFAAQLEDRSIRLLVVPTPTKAMVYPEAVGTPERSQTRDATRLHNPSFAPLAFDLERAGIEILDPAAALGKARADGDIVFLRTDSHWTPVGVDIVARAIAHRLAAMEVALGDRRVWRRGREVRGGIGDLARLLEPAAAEPTETVAAAPVTDEAGSPWRSAPGAAVLLLGDSFTGIYSGGDLGWGEHAGLAEQLAFHLGHDVASLTVQAGSSDAVRRRFADALARGELGNVRVVVWQLAVRELAFGDWSEVVLGEEVSGSAIARTNATRRIAATVSGVARAPSPDETPYPNALIALHLVDVRVMDEGLPSIPESILVYTWGLRGGRAVAGARLRVGQAIEVELLPWVAVAADLGDLERRELADPSLLTLDAFWMETP